MQRLYQLPRDQFGHKVSDDDDNDDDDDDDDNGDELLLWHG